MDAWSKTLTLADAAALPRAHPDGAAGRADAQGSKEARA
jgi:hypothetical protein